MHAGQLQERIEIQSATAAEDTAGGRSRTWSTAYTVRAHVRNVRGVESELHGERRSIETYLITIRDMAGVSTEMRVVWGSKTMNIASMRGMVDSRSRWLLLECEVGVRE